MKATQRKRYGLSLAELILSLGLVSVISLAIVGVFSSLLLGTSKSSTQAGAELLARSVLDSAARSDPETWPSQSTFQSRNLVLGHGLQPVELFYRLESEALGQHRMGELHQLRVTVTWDEANPEGYRVGQGKNWVEQGRMIYVESSL